MSSRIWFRRGPLTSSGLWFAAFLSLGACAGGEDSRRQCTNTTDCAPEESCEAGVCLPVCTPGVDCPEKDVSSGDAADATDADGAADEDGADGADGQDADASADVGDGEDGGPEVTPDEELACESERALATYDEGRAFEVRFGERSTGVIALPEGWTVEPACCGPGCCQ
jgi:hypothetical protein